MSYKKIVAEQNCIKAASKVFKSSTQADRYLDMSHIDFQPTQYMAKNPGLSMCEIKNQFSSKSLIPELLLQKKTEAEVMSLSFEQKREILRQLL